MKSRSILILIIALQFITPIYGYCYECYELVEQHFNCNINWFKGIIQARGIGSCLEKYYGKPQAQSLALEAAKLNAKHNLFDMVKKIRIDSTNTVNNVVGGKDMILSKISEMVNSAQVIEKEYLSDGTVEVTVMMSIRGGFAQLVLPDEIKQIESIRPMTGVYTSSTSSTSDTLATTKNSKIKVFTGMVVDARGTNAKPAMTPKIFDENGQEAYGPAYVSREYAVQYGLSGYAIDLAAAQSDSRVKNNPLTVKGLKSKGHGSSDIVISNADASKLRSSSEHLSFMKECHVIIVID